MELRSTNPKDMETVMNDSIHSSYREKLLEHLLIGELLKESWKTGSFIEVSRPEADRSGYDVILESGKIVRHIQLKTRKKDGKAQNQKVHLGLGEKASGCVIVILFDENLNLGPFLFLGGSPGEPLDSLTEFHVAKHTKSNSNGVKTERPNLRVVGHGRFRKIESIAMLSASLFGE